MLSVRNLSSSSMACAQRSRRFGGVLGGLGRPIERAGHLERELFAAGEVEQ